MLVNNVGTSLIKQYHNIEPQQIIDIINTNCTSMTVITTYILKMMIKRTKKSAIINLSSFLNEKSYPYLILYAATKSFNK